MAELQNGLSVDVLDQTARVYGLPPAAFARALGMTERTLKRRRDSMEARLTSMESDRLLHAREVFDQAVDAFQGRVDYAAEWLTSPKLAFNGATPADQLATRYETRIVEQMLISMTHLMPV